MKLSMNGRLYDVPRDYQEKLMRDVLEEGKKDYEHKLSKKWRVIAMAPARLLLVEMEKHAAKQIGAEAAREAIRPKKGEDPVLKLAWCFANVVLEGLKHVALHIDTDGQGTVSAFGLVIEGAGEAGRLVGLDRGEGEREINRSEIS